jgi:NTE family protein
MGHTPRVAFVLGGGGVLGASEVGMLQALSDAGIVADVVLGTSIGAVNGVAYAADPDNAPKRLAELWTQLGEEDDNPFSGSMLGRLATLARTRTAVHEHAGLRDLLASSLPVSTFEELAIPFQCVAASIERARAVWFDHGELIPPVLASCAVPGLLPPVRIGDEHFYDGGLVHSIPVGRAIELGAETIFALHVGRVEAPLTVPEKPWQVGLVAFEIGRRHRFHEEVDKAPPGLVHVLPTGYDPPRWDDPRQLRQSMANLTERIEAAREATATYLAFLDDPGGPGPRVDEQAR